MTENKRYPPLFKSVVPSPTNSDLLWRKKAIKKELKPTKGLIRSLIRDNHVWRLDHLVKQSPEKIDLGKTSSWEAMVEGVPEPSVLGAGFKEVGRSNAMLYVMENFTASLHNISSAFYETQLHNSISGLYVVLKDKSCTEDMKRGYLNRIVEHREVDFLPAFFEAGYLDINDPIIIPLLLAVRNKDLNLVTRFVEHYKADISRNGYAALRESERLGAHEIRKYLEDKSDVVLENGNVVVKDKVKLLTADTVKKPIELIAPTSEKWRKISDSEILEVSVSNDKFAMFTRLFNFAAHEVTQTQYIDDKPPPYLSFVILKILMKNSR